MQIRKYILTEGAYVEFPFVDGFDWHRNHNLVNDTSVSLHIYGQGYSLDSISIYNPSTSDIAVHESSPLIDIPAQLK